MVASAAEAKLEQIPTARIDLNPDNPRLVFRPAELAELVESIRVYGVQVPISVYREGGRFVLIDGERRLKCSLKLNRRTIPALVQEKPSPLENLLLMFNIHALREQWDLLTIALKLPKIISFLERDLGKTPTVPEIAEKTGLNRGLIRRCKLLMALPQQYKDQILEELKKPKSKQLLTEDLFIELERALTTVERAIPQVIPDRDRVRRVLLRKFKDKVITNRVHFRNIAKIARAERVGIKKSAAAAELGKLFQANNYSIESAYGNSVGEAYRERDLSTRVDSLLALLDDIDVDELEPEVEKKLERLAAKIATILGNTR
jgi:ParB family chromosome partitioning protein